MHRQSLNDDRSAASREAWWTVRRSAAFVVPRGGDREEESDMDACDFYSDDNEEVDDNIVLEYDHDEKSLEERGPSHILSFPSQQSLATTMAHYASMLVKIASRTCQAGARAMFVREEEGMSPAVQHNLLGRTAHVFGEMYHAAMLGVAEECGESEDLKVDNGEGHGSYQGRRRRRRKHHSHRRHRNNKNTATAALLCNGGGIDEAPESNSDDALMQFARQYGATIATTEEDASKPLKNYHSILLSSHTSLSEALQKANTDARFLICYISPKSKNKSVGISRNNKIAIPNLLSQQFVKIVNKKPLGKKQAESTGSFYIWICNGDNDSTSASEIQTAMKRLKVKPPISSSGSKKKKAKDEAPILAIVYPASAIDPSKPNRLKVSPRLLAQHHCHPPPSTVENLIAWVSTIRKRHLREYAKLQHDRKEVQLLEERHRGYVTSIKEDAERQKKEERELKLKKEEEEQEQMRKEQLEQRRQEFLESLPEEPEVGIEGAITIALRFEDGSRDQRRFMAEETTINDVLNWIDGVHKMEREKVVLTTMNGQKRFVYVDDGDDEEEGDESKEKERDEANVTLEQAGLSKMTALRVSEIVEEKSDNEEENEEE